MEAKKAEFLKKFFSKEAGNGNITRTCQMCGMARRTFYYWLDNDPEFSAIYEEWPEMVLDNAEEKLRELVDAGDTTALIFLLKTKGRRRGYSEKDPSAQQARPAVEAPVSPPPVQAVQKIEIGKKIENKKRYIVKTLKKEGKYSGELSMQVTIAAQLLVRVDILAGEIFSPGHSPVSVEYSREGNERQSIDAKEKLYLDYTEQAWRALRALGMNVDSKERKGGGDDGFGDFLKTFGEND